jgi:hypothetical protein
VWLVVVVVMMMKEVEKVRGEEGGVEGEGEDIRIYHITFHDTPVR